MGDLVKPAYRRLALNGCCEESFLILPHYDKRGFLRVVPGVDDRRGQTKNSAPAMLCILAPDRATLRERLEPRDGESKEANDSRRTQKKAFPRTCRRTFQQILMASFILSLSPLSDSASFGHTTRKHDFV